jgi:hypothetical protein
VISADDHADHYTLGLSNNNVRLKEAQESYMTRIVPYVIAGLGALRLLDLVRQPFTTSNYRFEILLEPTRGGICPKPSGSLRFCAKVRG